MKNKNTRSSVSEELVANLILLGAILLAYVGLPAVLRKAAQGEAARQRTARGATSVQVQRRLRVLQIQGRPAGRNLRGTALGVLSRCRHSIVFSRSGDRAGFLLPGVKLSLLPGFQTRDRYRTKKVPSGLSVSGTADVNHVCPDTGRQSPGKIYQLVYQLVYWLTIGLTIGLTNGISIPIRP